MNSGPAFFAGIVIGAALSFLATSLIAEAISNSWWQREAVRRRFAEFDYESGKWRWLKPSEIKEPKSE